MNRRSFFNIAVACAGTLAGLGKAQAMPIVAALRQASSLGQSSVDMAGEEAHVEKAAVIITRRVIRPRRVIVVRRPRRPLIRRLLRRL